jgi:hypothetical protein
VLERNPEAMNPEAMNPESLPGFVWLDTPGKVLHVDSSACSQRPRESRSATTRSSYDRPEAHEV